MTSTLNSALPIHGVYIEEYAKTLMLRCYRPLVKKRTPIILYFQAIIAKPLWMVFKTRVSPDVLPASPM
jgi:hypothetical protein